MLKNRICISGDVGSGKSSITKALKEQLSLPSYSTGDFQRQLAAQKGLTTLELNQYAETHPEVDFEIDQISKNLNDSEDAFILDSRLGWHFIPSSFKIFVTLDDNIAAERILNDPTRDKERYSNLTTAIQAVIERKKSEQERYLKLYQVDLRNFSNYNLIVDSSKHSIDKITTEIIKAFKAWQENEPFNSQLFF